PKPQKPKTPKPLDVERNIAFKNSIKYFLLMNFSNDFDHPNPHITSGSGAFKIFSKYKTETPVPFLPSLFKIFPSLQMYYQQNFEEATLLNI
ncbi:MAG: hypothetical protein AAB433_19330, partial [Nitrospirota bacterium]